MKTNPKKPAKKRIKKALNITVPDDVRQALEERSRHYDISMSKIITALAKVYCAIPVGLDELGVESDLKKALGRSQFIAFLKAVGEVMPPEAEPIKAPGVKPDYEPEAWRMGEVGVLAFYAPSEENIGGMFAKASGLKMKHKLKRVLAVTTNGNTVPAEMKRDLALAGIEIVSLAGFAAALARATKGRKS